MHFDRLGRGELVAAVGGLLLARLPVPALVRDRSRQPERRRSTAPRGGAQRLGGAPDILRWLLLAAAAAPFILIWIVIRDHELSWPRGEMTAVAAIAAFGLVAYTGLLDRPGTPSGAISLALGLLRRAAGHDPDDRRRRDERRPDRTSTQAPGGHVDERSCRPQPRARARARDRGGRPVGGAARRPGRQGGRRPGGRRRHARRAAHRPHGRHRGDRRGREGRGADAAQRRAGRQRRAARGRHRGRPARGHAAGRRRPAERAGRDRAVRARHDVRSRPVRLHGEDGGRRAPRRPARPRPPARRDDAAWSPSARAPTCAT